MLYYAEPHAFTPDEMELAAVIATQAAYATERVLAAEKDREQSERLREQAALLDMAHDAVIVMTMDGAIEFWNAGAERMYGWTATEAVGRDSTELLATVFREPRDA